MSCMKISFLVLLISLSLGYFYGDKIHSIVPRHVLKEIESFVPSEVMAWWHGHQAKPATSEKITEKVDQAKKSEPHLFTKEELWKYYRGDKGSKGLYLAFMGKVYDVSAGKTSYQPGGGYDFFAGRDGTKGFVTGDFSDEGLTDVLDGLDENMFGGFKEWQTFYATTYKFIGFLIGNFYDKNGQPTAALKNAESKIKSAMDVEKKRKEESKKYPMCNSESSAAKGSRVWCSNRSGGVERDWVGVPRLYHAPGATHARCACVRNTGPPTEGKDMGKNTGDLNSPYMKEYKNCKPDSPSCVTVPPRS
ncbi:neuferricin-like [Clavelina lepadiformis]|uniref:neuferricin-like n=1 Tax=Clavelina lepadiformis TaxID=159417 RepID=UPI004042CFB1